MKAIPKGNLLKEISTAFFEGRKLISEDNSYVLVKPRDVCMVVASHGADSGYATLEVLKEDSYSKLLKRTLVKSSDNKLCLISKSHNNLFNGCRILTQFPRSTEEYIKSLGVVASILKIHGASEAYPSLGLADFVVDVVSSGQTLRENRLFIVDTLFTCDLYKVERL
jgi:ATP phosphoribosyltransferase